MESIAVAHPPQRDNGGLPDRGVLAACALLGVTEVYAVGGAQAVAVLGYGAGSCEPVDMVTGPGNVYVTAAKRLLRGLIGIDSEAGPTEVAILADDTADPVHVTADLISQAEHDPLAGAVLVTTSEQLADAVTALLPSRSRPPSTASGSPPPSGGSQSGIVLVDDLDAGLAVVDAYAAEHLEIQTRDPARSRCGCATPARCSSAPGPRSASATTPPGPTTCCPPAAAPGTPAACPCRPSCAASTSSTTTSRRWPGSPGTSTCSPTRRTSRARGRRRRPPAVTALPLRPELQGRSPYGARRCPPGTG